MNTRRALPLLLVIILIVPLLVTAQDAATRPSDDSAAPVTRPSFSRSENFRTRRRQRRPSEIAASPAVMPSIYDSVGDRNIFIKGNQRPAPASSAAQLNSAPSGPYVAAANQLVLTGVSLEGNLKVAFLEDQTAFTVNRYKIGDLIAGGKIVNITLDALQYKNASGNVISVQVGDDLAGGSIAGGYSSTGGAAASTQPAAAGPRAPGESMEDYLRRRRAAELNH